MYRINVAHSNFIGTTELTQKLLNKIARYLGPILIRLLVGSLRIKRIDQKYALQAKEKHCTVIYTFWHNRQLILAYAHRNEQVHILISQHQDGEYITLATRGLGYGAVRGSTTRGGFKAMRELTRVVEKYDVAFTPDGPRGPKEKSQDGVIYLALISKKPIIPVSCTAKKKWILNSWDNFIIPKPFTQARIIYGEPIFVKSKQEIGEKKQLLERILIELGNKIEY